MLRADTGPHQIALRKVAPSDQYTRNLHAACYESPGLGAHCLLVWAHMPARAVPHGIASLAMICPAAAVCSPAHWSCTARGGTARHGAARHGDVECSDDLAAASEQGQDLCCGLRNVNPLACRYRHDHSPATSLASITNSWQHGAAQRVPCLSMEGSRCAKELVVEPMNGRLYLAVKAYGSGRRACRCATWCFNRCQVHVEISGNGLHPVPPSQLL